MLSYDAIADGVPAAHAVRRVLQTIPLPQVAPRQRASGPPVAAPPLRPARQAPRASSRSCYGQAAPPSRARRTSSPGVSARHEGMPVLPTLDLNAAEPLLRKLELTVRNKLDGLLQGNYARARARSWVRGG